MKITLQGTIIIVQSSPPTQNSLLGFVERFNENNLTLLLVEIFTLANYKIYEFIACLVVLTAATFFELFISFSRDHFYTLQHEWKRMHLLMVHIHHMRLHARKPVTFRGRSRISGKGFRYIKGGLFADFTSFS